MIKLTPEEIQKCEEFANSVDTSFYAKRNQTNANKRKLDSKIGKMGEIIAYNELKDKIKDLTYPDFKIYSAKEKSWDFDLKGFNHNIHVKSQEINQGKKFGVSFLFQYGNGSNRSYDKEIFDQLSENQYVAFVSVDLANNQGEIVKFVILNDLHKYDLFKAPILPQLQNANKKAVYLKDMNEFIK